MTRVCQAREKNRRNETELSRDSQTTKKRKKVITTEVGIVVTLGGSGVIGRGHMEKLLGGWQNAIFDVGIGDDCVHILVMN